VGLRTTIAVGVGGLAVAALAARVVPPVAVAGWYALWESQ
jgi:hypothetical protein